jgi:hypothetical protein
MKTVFISYRREDASGEARALFSYLANRLGEKSVFMDVDSIALGRDFRAVLQDTTAACDLMLVLIGNRWAGARDENGGARLDNPVDYVRLEIESALKRNIPVTPVLVQGVHMPGPEQLPAEIRDLAYRNAFELSHNRWESDVREMTRRLLGPDAPAVRPHKTKRRVMWVLVLSLLVAALLIALLWPAPQAVATIQVLQNCTGDGPVCDQRFTRKAGARGRASAEFTVGREHCAPMRLHFYVDDKEVDTARRDFGWAGGTRYGPLTISDIDLGLVNADSDIGLEAEVLEGGCAANPLAISGWQGELTLTITRGSLITY